MIRWAGWLVAAALAGGCATDNSVGGSSHIGKVQGVYVEQYGGLFVDRQMATEDAGKPVWVYVTFDHALEDGSRFATAVLEQDPGIEAGDLVQLRFAHDGDPQPGAAPAHNQVTALIAKRDTPRARAFGSAPAPAAETIHQAAADPRP
jgi:hypothetical protein